MARESSKVASLFSFLKRSLSVRGPSLLVRFPLEAWRSRLFSAIGEPSLDRIWSVLAKKTKFFTICEHEKGMCFVKTGLKKYKPTIEPSIFQNSNPAPPPLITTVGTLKQHAEPHILFVEVSWGWRCVDEVADKTFSHLFSQFAVQKLWAKLPTNDLAQLSYL